MLVSVIIPTYNRADKVVEAIRSVQNQTYPDKQIIVVDDGSQDDTRRRIEKLPGIEYYYQNNSRQGAARNTGLKYARGDYIATLDSDDIWEKDFLSASVDCSEKHRLDFVFSNWLTQTDGRFFPNVMHTPKFLKKYGGNSFESWFLLDSKQVRKLFINCSPAPSSSLLIRRESMVCDWNTSLKIADDWGLVLDMVLAKPCRAAFTMRCLWTKNVNHQNIYDGRSRKEIALELDIHDTRLLKRRHSAQLTFSEKNILDWRIAKGYLILASYFVKDALRVN